MDSRGGLWAAPFDVAGLDFRSDPVPVLMEALRESGNQIEANLTLNSVALLQDAKGVEFDLTEFADASWAQGEKKQSKHRMDYLLK